MSFSPSILHGHTVHIEKPVQSTELHTFDVQGEAHNRTGREGQKTEYRYSYILLTRR